jgi:hypothetical protein
MAEIHHQRRRPAGNASPLTEFSSAAELREIVDNFCHSRLKKVIFRRKQPISSLMLRTVHFHATRVA